MTFQEKKNYRAKVPFFIFSVSTHDLTDLICQIKKIEIKLYAMFQSVLLTEFCFSDFLAKGNYFIYFKRGLFILCYLEFSNIARVSEPW